MIKATQGQEIVLETMNEVGVLAEVSKAISEKGIDISAVGAWTNGPKGMIHIVTDDNHRAVECLEKRSFTPSVEKVVVVELPHRPGMLRELSESLLEAEINVRYFYASAYGAADRCRAVLATSDNARAVVVLNRKVAPARA